MKNRAMCLSLMVVVAGCGAAQTERTGGPSGPAESLPEQMIVPAAPEPSASPGASPADPAVPASSQYVYPAWQRVDVQPESPKALESYGLEEFRGRTVVVVLLEGFCTFCQNNAKVAAQLQAELRDEKRDAEIVILSDSAATQFVGKVAMRVFRDAEAGRPAWQQMRTGASKHDTFVFGPNGQRTYFWEGSFTGDARLWTQQVGEAVRAVSPVTN